MTFFEDIYPFFWFLLQKLWRSKKTLTSFFKTEFVPFFIAEYAEKYQEMLARQDYFHDTYGENGNEVWVQDRIVMLVHGRRLIWTVVYYWET